MGSSSFRIRLLIRIAILLLCWSGAIYLVFARGLFFSAVLCAALSIVMVIELLIYIMRIHREMDTALRSILANDFLIHFPVRNQAVQDEIRRFSNQIIDRFRELRQEKEKHAELVQQVISILPVGVLCIQNQEQLVMMNPAALNTLGFQVAPGVARMKELFPVLFGRQPENHVIRLRLEGVTGTYAFRRMDFRIGADEYQLITLENISSELDQKETESWKTLMRVLNHEIVNSITPIVSLSASLRDEVGTDSAWMDRGDMRDAMNAISRRSEALLKFAEGYRVFTTANEPKKERINIVATMYDIRQLFAHDARVGMLVNGPATKPEYVLVDETHLQQVMINLVKNALESHPQSEACEVKLGLNITDDEAELFVSDNGAGMEDEVLAKIFVPYFTTKPAGQGIGLSLSKQLIQANGGRIRVISKPGSGTTVGLIFKLA